MENNENTPWQYKPEGDDADVDDTSAEQTQTAAPQPAKVDSISWQNVEFIEHPHNAAWYGTLVLVTAVLTIIVYFVTKDYIATSTIPIVGIIVGIFARQKPGVVQYEISRSGMKVGAKTYTYNLFKSFSVLQEGGLSSVNLFPLKRFMPPVAAYFDPADQPKIINALGEYLPYEERKMDSIDRLSRRLRL